MFTFSNKSVHVRNNDIDLRGRAASGGVGGGVVTRRGHNATAVALIALAFAAGS